MFGWVNIGQEISKLMSGSLSKEEKVLRVNHKVGDIVQLIKPNGRYPYYGGIPEKMWIKYLGKKLRVDEVNKMGDVALIDTRDESHIMMPGYATKIWWQSLFLKRIITKKELTMSKNKTLVQLVKESRLERRAALRKFAKSKTKKRTPHKSSTKNEFNDWCTDTNSFELKTKLIYLGSKKYLLRHGRGSLGFICIHKGDFTVAQIYTKKDKEYLSTRRFNRKVEPKKVKELIFDNAIHVVDAKKKSSRPFRVMYKQAIISIEVFKDKFKPNTIMKRSYTSTGKDLALVSLSELLEDIQARRFSSGKFHTAIKSARKAINTSVELYKGNLPAVNVYAIWTNFDPESNLITTKNYNSGEPLLYKYDVITK